MSAAPLETPDVMEAVSADLSCPVCLQLLSGSSLLNCGHLVCTRCLRELRSHYQILCPVCRSRVVSITQCPALDRFLDNFVGKFGSEAMRSGREESGWRLEQPAMVVVTSACEGTSGLEMQE